MKVISFARKAQHFLARVFITPWQNVTRAKILILGLLANASYGVLSFMLNYSMAVEGPMSSLVYQVFRMLMMAYVFVPFTFWFLTRYKSPWLLALIQLLGISLYFIDRSSGLLNGLAIALIFSPFLAMFGYRFATNRTKDNQGNETALNSFLSMSAYSIGLFGGGVALQLGYYYSALVVCSFFAITGAFFLYCPVEAKRNARKVWRLLGKDKPSSRITFFAGLFNVMVEGGLPIWMHALGISPLVAGINMSIRPLIGMALTPLAGWLVQKGGLKAGQLGGIVMVLGWVLVAAGQTYVWLLSWGLALLSIGMGLLNPMEVGRWFKRRSAAGVTAREMLYATGRIPAYVAVIAVSFWAPVTYPLLGLGISGLFMMNARPKRGGLGRLLKRA